MNYRHIYHAGNFADVMKHLVLTLCLEHLKAKDKGFCVIDAHGGRGLYPLDSEEMEKTGEWKDGVGKLVEIADAPPPATAYLSMVKKDLAKHRYPGSPLIAARLLRPQDRLIASELHPEDVKTLKMVMGSHDNVSIEHKDAYECIRAHLPPPERRGLILIDPPFEEKDEFERLTRQMKEWARRFPTGTYLLWYPIKAHLPYAGLDAAAAAHFPDRLTFETLRFAKERTPGLNGCGLLILNPPYTLAGALDTISSFLRQHLTLHDLRIKKAANDSTY